MSKKCKAYSESRLGLEPADNRKSFYAGWDAALRAAQAEMTSFVDHLKANPEQAKEFFQRAGILDADGNLRENYRASND